MQWIYSVKQKLFDFSNKKTILSVYYLGNFYLFCGKDPLNIIFWRMQKRELIYDRQYPTLVFEIRE